MQIETNLRPAAGNGGPSGHMLPDYPTHQTDPADPASPARAGLVARLLASLCLPAIFFGLLFAARAQSPPANDNLTNAQPILGLSGTVNGNNQYATTQTGEPAPVSTVLSGASIWYLWTAPMAAFMDFDTHNSTLPSGAPLDTVMAVYSLVSPNSPLILGNLTKVASNDDDANNATWPGVSRVNFQTVAGTTYLIQIEGKIVSGVTNEGYVVLNWQPAVYAGQLSFATNLNVFGQQDNSLLIRVLTQYGTLTNGLVDEILPSLMNTNTLNMATNAGSTASTGQGRVTLVRRGGFNGRIQVDVTPATDYYENEYETNIWTTNIYIGPSDANGVPTPGGTPSTNYSYTITNYYFYLDYDSAGLNATYLVTNYGILITSNATGFPAYRTNWLVCNSNYPGEPGGSLSLPPAISSNVVTTTTTTNTNYFVVLTNVVVTPLSELTFSTPSAIDGVDFYSTDYQTVTFDDWQMSKDAFMNISPSQVSSGGVVTSTGEASNTGGPDWPDIFGNKIAPGIPRRVILTLSNPRLDPLESPDVAAPTLAPDGVISDAFPDSIGGGELSTTNSSVAELTIQDFYNPPITQKGEIPNSCKTYTMYNFIRRVLRTPKPPINRTNQVVHIPVYRTATGTSATVSYSINGYPTYYLDQPGFLEPGSDNAISQEPADTFPLGNYDFTLYTGSITFGVNSDYEFITITNNNNGAVEFDMEYEIMLTGVSGDNSGMIGNIGTNHLSILSDANLVDVNGVHTQQQPGGAADRSWNYENLPDSTPPYNSIPGANLQVEAVAIQPNGMAVFGGQFTDYDSATFNYLARADTNGRPDLTFNPGSGPGGATNNNNFVSAITVDAVGRIYIGGNFTSYNGVSAYYVARLNQDGSLDTSFNTGRGANGIVWALALDSAGNVLIGGDFTTYGSTNRAHIARLIGNGPLAGSLDTSFNPGSGTDLTVRAVAADSLTNVIIGGAFTTVNGTNWPGLARLTPTGALDTNFNPGTDVNGPVYCLAVQPADNKIVIGGSFSQVNLTNLNCIARINFNGSVDNSFAPGAGINGPVYCLAIQPDQNILVGGQFTSVETVRRVGYARLLANGWLDTSFLDTSYNQFAGLINHYYNPYAFNPNDLPIPANFNEPNYVNALALDHDGNVFIGGSFIRIGGGYSREDVNVRWNLARIVGPATPGPQGDNGGIGNCPGNLGFSQNSFSVSDTAGSRFITVDRVNGSLAYVNIVMATNSLPPGPGAATAADYGLVNQGVALYGNPSTIYINGYGWRDCDGEYGFNNSTAFDAVDIPLAVTIYDPRTRTNNLTANLSLLSVNDLDTFNLGGMYIPTLPAPGMTSASLQIINDNYPAGTLGFSATNYNVTESAGYATITVLRTNGSFGQLTVNFKTQNGFTNDPNVQPAVAGQDYIYTNGYLTFANGAPSASFKVRIIDFSSNQPNKFFNVVLSNPTGGASFDTNNPPLLVTNAVVTIVDDNFLPGHLSFNSAAYGVTKGGTAVVGVERTGGALGIESVQCLTANGTGSNGVNYSAVSTNLQWTNGDVSVKYVYIPTLEDHVVEGTRTVNVLLTNAVVANFGTGAPTNSMVLIYPSNAVLSIADDDFYGQLNFYATNINVLQNAGQAIVTVVRTGGTVGTITVNYATANGAGLVSPLQPALAGTNYGATNGMLIFGDGVTSTNFVVPIYYTPAESNAANRVINLTLYNPNPSAITNGNPYPKSGTITILDPQLVTGSPGSVDTTLQTGSGFNGVVNSLSMQPDGKVLAGGAFTFAGPYPLNQIARLNPDGSVDSGFLYLQAGSDGIVQQVLSQTPSAGQTDGSIMVVGAYAHMDGVPRNNISRLNLDGSLDETFNPGSGADNTIYCIVETQLAPATSNGPSQTAYIIGGAFVNYNGVQSSGVARITSTGQADPNFSPGNGVTSTNGAVHALAVQANGQVIVGGDFISFNNVPYHHLVRLNLDGSVDPTFNADTGGTALGSVHAICIQPNGQILIGGVFTNVDGVAMNHIARLNPDGSLDNGFNPGLGANNTVETIVLDSQGNILLGGEFTRASGVTRNGITRLNPDGTVDPTINFGAGANGYVLSLAIQANDEINVAGSFSSFGGYVQNNFTRLFGGQIFGPGSLAFSGPVFGVVENQTNAVVTVQRSGGTGDASFPLVSALVTTSDGTALHGVDYTGVTNTVSFPIGETFTNVLVPIINNGVVSGNKSFNVNLSNPFVASLGYQSSALVIITNANSAVAFSSASYRQSENVPGGAAVIPVVRIGSPLSNLTVTVYTGSSGSAAPNVDYIPVSQVMVFGPGVSTNLFLVPLLNNTNMLSDRTVDLELSDPIGGFLTTPSSATLTIASVYAGPGVLSFDQPSYSVSEAATNMVINILRTNGVTGVVSALFATSNGTATAGVNYEPVSQVLNFSDGQTSQSVSIPIIQQTIAMPDTTVFVTLSNPSNTTISGPAVETLTIVNDIQNFTLGSPDYFVSEASPSLTFSVFRNGPTNGTVSVGYTTVSPTNAYGTNGYAIPGFNYGPTNGVLTFGPGQTLQTVPIAIYQQKTVDNPETFQVVLTNASAGTQIGSPGAAEVTIIGDVTGFEMDTNSYVTGEMVTNVVVTVNRLNVNTGNVSVNFATGDGSAVAGVDYVATNGVLNFADGQASANVTISILNPGIVENTKSFNFSLSNPLSSISTNIYLLSPSNAVISITNTVTGFAFSSPAYSVNEKGVQAQITVLASGPLNANTSVQFATANGTGTAGTNYFATNGTLNFAPGVASQSFTVDVIDDHIITADHTVILNLSNPQGAGPNQPILATPSIAILTIQEGDGSYIVNAGQALVYESFKPTNGLIDPGETVTLDFGLRCVSGGNTTNLVATLQANSGVSPVLPNAQSYGVLQQGGHAVSEPFTFTANGTNSQVINAVFQLQDGPRNLSTVVFSFTLGTSTTSFSNTNLIYVPATNFVLGPNPTDEGPASPYPAPITVSGLAGTVGKVTVTVSNITHSLPSDIEMVLVSPSTNVLLMNAVGGDNGLGVTNFSVTFDDAAATYLSSNQLVNNSSATNKPTPYYIQYMNDSVVAYFIGNNWGFLPAMTSPAPAAPYPTNLSVFVGTAANGIWSLYVTDTQPEDYGAISNGWTLNLSTGNPVPSYTDLELSVVPATPFPTVGNNLVYTVGLTNYGPAGATGVVITNILPPGLAYSGNNFPGSVVNNNGVLTFAVNSLAVGAGVSFNVTNTPLVAATLTNAFVAVSAQLEASTNNATNIVAVVNQPSADLGISLAATPNPVTAGDFVTITLVATNNGPSLASATFVTNFLPQGLLLTTNSASTGTVSSSSGMNIWNAGSLPAFASATLSLTAMATNAAGATVLDTVVVGSSTYDPIKLNNFASFKIVINPAPTLSFVLGARAVTFTWTNSATNYVLQGATNLTPPVVWVLVPNVPAIVNGQYSVTVPTNSLHFFKLTTP